MKLTAIQPTLALFALAAPVTAQVAPQVQTGCAQPPITFNHIWTIDPVNGFTPAQYAAMKPPIPMPTIGQGPTPSTQGSAQHPWNSAGAVFAQTNGNSFPGYPWPLLSTAPYTHAALTNPPPSTSAWAYATVPGKWTSDPTNLSSPIQPGDEILLMSGNYGNINIAAYATAISIPRWITFAAAPGQTPVFSSIKAANVSNVQFIGIKVQQQAASYNGGLLIGLSDGGGGQGLYNTGVMRTHDIVFSQMDISNAEEAAADSWSQVQWYNNTGSLVTFSGSAQNSNTYCLSVTHSHIHGGHFLVSHAASQSLFADDELDHFADDAFDWGGNANTFTRNFIHDPVDLTQVPPVSITAISATGVFTGSNSYKAGEAIDFAGPLPATGLAHEVVSMAGGVRTIVSGQYFILPGVTSTTFQVSATPGGAPIVPTGFVSGLIAAGSPSGTPLVYAHVDDMQAYTAAHPAGTILYWTGDVIDSNVVIDRFDPANPWPTVSNGINDYAGDNTLGFDVLNITNNLMVTGGLQAILFDAKPDGTSQIAGNTVIDDGWGASINSTPQIDGNSGIRVCNNIAPIIVAQTTRGSTQDHNLATGQIIYNVQNPDGSFQKNPSYFGGNGWYGPTGRANSPDATHTSAVIKYQKANQARLFRSLAFNADGTTAYPTRSTNGSFSFNLALAPGPATTIATVACGTPTNINGHARHGVAAPAPARAAAAAAAAPLPPGAY